MGDGERMGSEGIGERGTKERGVGMQWNGMEGVRLGRDGGEGRKASLTHTKNELIKATLISTKVL